MTIRAQAFCFILTIMLSAAAMNGEQAKMADAFVDSIGVCCHFSEQSSPYYLQTAQAISAFQRSRIRHARDNSWSQSDPGNAKRAALISAMSAIGIRLGFNLYCEMDCGDATHTVVPMLQQNLSLWIAASNIDSFEGPNEHTGAWACAPTNEFNLQLQAFQPSLYAKVRASAAYSAIPVIGPSIYDYSGACTAAIGNLTNYMTYANHHSYPVGMMPSWNINRGNGTAITLSNQPYTASMYPMNGVMPVIVTETGYYTALSNSGDGTTEAQGGKYYSRLFFEYFNAGAVRTYAYELFDEPWRAVTNEPMGGKEANFGLIRSNGTDKPAFTAIINEIALLEDKGAAFTPGTLNYGFSITNSRMHHTLLQKRDKTFYLILWLEYSYWETFSSQSLTITFEKQMLQVRQYDPLLSSNAFSTGYNVSSLGITVGDKALILEITCDTNSPAVSTTIPGCITNRAFTNSLSVNENFGYWSTNGSAYCQFDTNGTNLLITAATALSYYGCDAAGNYSTTNTVTYQFDTNAPVVSGAPAGFMTNQPFTVYLTVNENYGYWSTNGSAYRALSTSGTNILIATNTILSYYGRDALGNTGVTNTRTYVVGSGYPDTPQFPVARAVDGNTVSFRWQDVASNETAFMVSRCTDAVSFTYLGSVAANITNFIDTGLSCDTRYYYRVIASNAVGVSVPSSAVSAYTAVYSAVSNAVAKIDARSGNVKCSYTVWKNCAEPEDMVLSFSPAGVNSYTPLATWHGASGTTNSCYEHVWAVPAGFDTGRLIDIRITPVIGTNTGMPFTITEVDLSRLFTLVTNIECATALNNPCQNRMNITFVNVPPDTGGMIYSVSGRVVKCLGAASGGERLQWDLHDDKGNNVPPGIYLCHLTSIAGSKVIKVMLSR